MAFKEIIHFSASPEHMQELYKTIDQFRAEKTLKYLAAKGVTYDTIHECLQKERIHNLC